MITVLIIYFCSMESYSVLTSAACTWPPDFADSTWTDSLKGDMDFASTTMTGWTFSFFAVALGRFTHINDWECVTYDTEGPYLVMKSTSTFELFDDQFTGYRCIKLKKITDFSYRYYQMNPVQSQLSYDRLDIFRDDSLTNISTLCTRNPATGSEFQMMLRKGFEGAATVTCPYNLLSDYTFTYADSDGSVPCDPVNDMGSMNMCSNVTHVTIPSLTCSAYPLYSNEDTVWCIDVVVVGTDTFVSLYNGLQEASSIDETATFQFTCVGINAGGTYMSVTPQHCKANQSTTEVPTSNTGSGIGAVLSLSIDGAPCPPCPVLSNPARGSVVKTTDGAVTTATYSCEGDYTLSGNDTRVCLTTGIWSGSQPSCTCPITTSIPHGSVSLSTDGLIAAFACDVGYVLVGDSNLTCNAVFNTWSSAYPTCDECQILSDPTNGSYTITSTGLTSIVTYSCSIGTTLNGDIKRTCNTDTSWTNNAPTCTSCPTLTSIASGNVTLFNDNVTTTATFYCGSDYTLIGDNTTTCQLSGVWDSTPPTCVCNAPISPDNGTVTISNDLLDAVYTCELGFTLQGLSTRTCQSDGLGWSYSDPICVGCPSLNSPVNGNVSLSTNGILTEATYSCDVGFSIKGDVTSQCQTDGTWSTSAPTCSQCDVLPTVSSGSYKLTSDGTTTSAEYTCNVGSSISGDVTVACDINGVWSIATMNTSCVACQVLSESGGSYTFSSNGTSTTAELVCSTGYTLVGGDATLQCQSDGTWTSSSFQSECVSTTPSAGGDSSSDSLLPAVIVLALLTVGLALALSGSLFYIWKLKKRASGNASKPVQNGSPSLFFQASKAPMDHTQHVMDYRNTASALSAPISHHPSPRLDSVTPRTPRTLQTSVSTGSVHLSHLNLIREDTASSVIFDHDQPAPWNKRPKPVNASSSSLQTKESFPPIRESTSLISTPRDHESHGNKGPRKKKQSISEKMKRQNSVSADGASDVMVNEQKRSHFVKSESAKPVVSKRVSVVSRNGSSLKSNGSTSVVPKLNLSRQPERASTPVKHQIVVEDPDKCRTPRSNMFATVQ